MLMTSADYRESLRRYTPRVFVDGAADRQRRRRAARCSPGINAIGVTYDFALARRAGADDDAPCRRRAARPSTGCCTSTSQQRRPAQQARGGAPALPGDRLRAALPGARRVQRPGPGRRARIDADTGTRYGERFTAYLHDVQDQDLRSASP